MGVTASAAKADPAIAADCQGLTLMFQYIHPIASAYRDLLRAEKLGLLEQKYTPEEAQRIFTMYRDMIYQSRMSSLSWEEFTQRVPKAPFQQGE
jgi:hypothetical protein